MPWLINKSVLLELHRADIGQRPVQPVAVVLEQLIDGFVLRLALRLEALAVLSLHLQRPEQRLAARIDAPHSCPAVFLSAHRAGDVVLMQHVLEVATRVLTAPVAMKGQPDLFARMALEPRHAQCIDHDLSRHVFAQRPTNNLVAEQIGHYRQEQPALVGCDIGDVAQPDSVGFSHSELAVQQGGRDRQVVAAVRGDLEAALAADSRDCAQHFYYQCKAIQRAERSGLKAKVRAVYDEPKGRYGDRRIAAALRNSLAESVNRKCVQLLGASSLPGRFNSPSERRYSDEQQTKPYCSALAFPRWSAQS